VDLTAVSQFIKELEKQDDCIKTVNRETDKWNAQGTTSSTALCVIFLALQAALIEQTGYKVEQ